jgi:prepilin-type N-terminal cleavage/methylation domain-containing protein
VVATDRKRNKKEMSDNCKGFTLIELIITLTLIVIVASIAVASFQKMAINSSLKTAIRDVASDFAQLKERAISGDATLGNRMYRISLNVAGNSYQLQQCNNPGSPCGGWTTIQNKNLSGYANDIIFGAGTAPPNYDFQTRGTVTNGTIVLGNSRNSTGTITINITGRTNVLFNLQ